MKRLKKWLKRLGYFLVFMVIFLLVLDWWLSLDPPKVANQDAWQLEREELGPNSYAIQDNWLYQNETGLWEAKVSGAPFERGAILGNLAQELVQQQEVYFVAQIHELVPSDAFLYVLRYLVGFFNRHLNEYVPVEYQKEIYGETAYCSDQFDAIGSNYERILNYHAAHDIGHALKDYAVVGCTAFAGWDQQTTDSSLVIGRNFDFYVGDDFAKDKIVLFVEPDSGYRFASITWGGFMGVASGMNEKGLTVTINAAKSGLPTAAKTPISIVARSILQYAQNIDEAIVIANSFETFVSESILIGSAQDHKTAIIEKSVHQTGVVQTTVQQMICSNHYQSATFEQDADNLENIASTASNYRQQRVEHWLEQGPLDYLKAAEILRDRQGLEDAAIGWGNEKAINQLQGHHSVIFMPEQGLMWVSTAPYQLGQYLAYDLNQVFAQTKVPNASMAIDSLTIPVDPFMHSQAFKNYQAFRTLKKQLPKAINAAASAEELQKMAAKIVQLNPDYYHAHQLAGDAYQAAQDLEAAQTAYTTALEKEIATLAEREQIETSLAAVQAALNPTPSN